MGMSVENGMELVLASAVFVSGGRCSWRPMKTVWGESAKRHDDGAGEGGDVVEVGAWDGSEVGVTFVDAGA
eukprot:3300778-Rhodomonas_salina.1